MFGKNLYNFLQADKNGIEVSKKGILYPKSKRWKKLKNGHPFTHPRG